MIQENLVRNLGKGILEMSLAGQKLGKGNLIIARKLSKKGDKRNCGVAKLECFLASH